MEVTGFGGLRNRKSGQDGTGPLSSIEILMGNVLMTLAAPGFFTEASDDKPLVAKSRAIQT